MKRKVSSLFKKKPVRSILKKPKDEKRRDDENSSVECLSNTAMATAGVIFINGSFFHKLDRFVILIKGPFE